MIPELASAAENVIGPFRQAGLSDIYVTTTADEIVVQFGNRPIGRGGPFADEIQKGAAAIFSF